MSGTSPRQVPVHTVTSLANKSPCILATVNGTMTMNLAEQTGPVHHGLPVSATAKVTVSLRRNSDRFLEQNDEHQKSRLVGKQQQQQQQQQRKIEMANTNSGRV